jgi:hypothetical protein
MKTSRTHLMIAFVVVSLPLRAAFPQTPAQPPMISVSGSAEVKIAPDEVYLSVGVETRHENLEEAKEQNDARVSKALAFLKTRNVEDKNVQTDFISIEPLYDNDMSRTKAVAYVVRKSIEVRLTDVEGFESILTGLLTNGVNHVHGIDFRTTELRKHRDAARAMAIRAATEKVDALAAELGVNRGRAHNVNASDGGGWWRTSRGQWGGRFGGGMFQNVVQDLGGASGSGDSTLSVGQISVSASVNASFLIE